MQGGPRRTVTIELGEPDVSDRVLAHLEAWIERAGWFPELEQQQRIQTAIAYLLGIGIGAWERMQESPGK